MALTERLAIVVDSEVGGALAGMESLSAGAKKAAAAEEALAKARAQAKLATIAAQRAAADLAGAQERQRKIAASSTATDSQKAKAALAVQAAEVKHAEAVRLAAAAQDRATASSKAYAASLLPAKASTEGLTKAIRGGFINAAAAGGLAAAAFGVKAVAAASDLSESTSKAGVVFGHATAEVLAFGDAAAKGIGQSKQQAIEAVGTFGNLFTAMGIGQKQAADLSISVVKLASDLASFNNTSPEDALIALKAGLVGETEPLRAFGVNLSAARVQEEALRQGLIKHASDVLPAATKAQITYSLILHDTTTAQGDFARTSTGLANQQRIVTAEFKDFAAAAGGVALPAAQKLFAALNAGLGPLTSLLSATDGAGKVVKDFGISLITLTGGLGVVRKAMDLVGNSGFGGRIKAEFATAVAGAAEAAAVSGRSVGLVSKLGIGISAVGKAIGPVGLALTTGAALLTVFGLRSHEADARVADLTRSIREQGGEITKTNRETAAAILAEKGILDAARQAGISTSLLTSAYLGNRQARLQVNDAIDAGLAVASKDIGAGKAQRTQTAEQIKAFIRLRDQFPGLIDAYDKSAAGQAKVAAAAVDVTAATRTWASVAEDAKNKMQAQKEAADRLKASLDVLSGANIDATQAEVAYTTAQKTLTEGVKENAKENRKTKDSLDANTDAGRKNLSNITALAQAANAYATARANQTNNEEAGRLVMVRARADFIKQVQHLGFTREAALRLADAYFRIPSRVKTEAELAIEAAKKKAAEIQRRISQIHGAYVTVAVTQTGNLQKITRDLEYIRGFGTIPVNIRVNGKVIGNAAGTDYWRGGTTLVGEKGPELVDLPAGSRILPADKTRSFLRIRRPSGTVGMGGGVTVAAGAVQVNIGGEVGRQTVALVRTEVSAALDDFARKLSAGAAA